MKHLITFTLIIALLLGWTTSCSKSPTAQSNKWPKVNSTFDSLTLTAERHLFNPVGYDSIEAVITRMDEASSGLKGRKALLAEAEKTYWQFYLAMCTGRQDVVTQLLDKGLQLADSADNIYIKHRFEDQYDIFCGMKDSEILGKMLEYYDYYTAEGDLGQAGTMAMFISNSLLYPPIPELSLQYLEQADSLFALAGLDNRRQGLGLNKFTLLGHLGQQDKAETLYEDLLTDARAAGDSAIMEVLMRNHYFFYSDSASLFGGYELIRPLAHPDSAAEGRAALRGLYEGLILSYCLKNSDLNGGGISKALRATFG